MMTEAANHTAEMFESATVTPDGIDVERTGLKRPTATWTYLVHDNPFGSELDRSISGIANRLRKKL